MPARKGVKRNTLQKYKKDAISIASDLGYLIYNPNIASLIENAENEIAVDRLLSGCRHSITDAAIETSIIEAMRVSSSGRRLR